MSDSVARLEGVHKRYVMGSQTLDVLRGVDLDVAPGECVALMGPSGSGKSTLLHLLGCLDRPTAGRVELRGIDVAGRGDAELSRLRNEAVGFVFQAFHLIPRWNVFENVALPSLYDSTGADKGDRVRELIEAVGLTDRIDHEPSELSGGERQRAAIARALVNDPDVVLADEPTGNLDAATGREILDLLDRFREGRRAVVLVTHDAEVARRADRVLELRDGRIDA